jgi:ATP-binding cassette subfamily C (CFTR/MRP) protein 1
MESLCKPYAEPGSDRMKSFCFIHFDLGFMPGMFLILVLVGCLMICRKEESRQVSSRVTFVVLLPVFTYFVQMTLLLFYKDIDLVSVAEFLDYSVNILLFLTVLYCYQFTFKSNQLIFTSNKTLKMVVVLRTLWSVFEFFVVVSNIDLNYEMKNKKKKEQDPVLVYFSIVLAASIFFPNLYLMWSSYSRLNKVKYVELVENLKDPRDEPEKTTYEKASIFSKLITWWIYPLLKLGNSRPLRQEDIEKIGYHESTSYQKKKMSSHIEKYLKRKNDSKALLKAVYSRFSGEIFGLVIIGLIANLMDFGGALFIKVVENYLESDEPIWRGYAIVFYMLLSKLIQAVANNHYRFLTSLLSVHIKAGLSSHIYEKTLTVSPSVLNSSSSDFSYAKIVNLMQVDLTKIAESAPYTVRALIWPFQFGIGIWLIYVTLGWKALVAGLIVMVVLFGLNGFLAKKMVAIQREVMIKKDSRMKILNEWLSSMKVLKLYNWEKKISEKVLSARQTELSLISKGLKYMTCTIFLNWGTRNYLIMAVLITMTLSGIQLTPGNVFAGTSVIGTLNMAIRFVPDIISNFVQSLISYKRIQDFLMCRDINQYVKNDSFEYAIDINNASFSWELDQSQIQNPNPELSGELKETKTVLKNISLKVKRGDLVAVVGKVGSGKSSIIHSLIQSMNFVRTSEKSFIKISGKIAYVSQESWIQNTTIKKNILFGSPENPEKYSQVLKVCQLLDDLKILPAGDQTEIGEKGINLSGGQKTRVAIARAVYSNADVFLFDDPLSAVDAHVGAAIFSDCFKNFLAGKTVLLVTNNQQFLPYADSIVMLHEGRVVETGTYDQLIQENGMFKNSFLVEIAEKTGKAEVQQKEEEVVEKSSGSNEKKIIEDEDRAFGSVQRSVYKTYIEYNGGSIMFYLVLFFMLCWQADRMYTDLYLSEWTDQSKSEQKNKMLENILIYSIASFTVNLFILFRLIVTISGGLKAARLIFIKMIQALVDAPVNKFYDVTPTGRILNRLSKDQNNIDLMLIFSLNGFIGQVFQVFCIVCLIGYIVPYLLIGLPFTLYLAVKIQAFFLASSRELIRMEGITRSPIVQHFSETAYGLSTLRAFSYQHLFASKNEELININTTFEFHKQAANCWMGIALEIVSDFFLVGSSLVIVSGRDVMGPALASLCLSYAITLPENIYWLVLSSTFLETNMVSVERCHQLSLTEGELPRSRFKDEDLKKRNWPEKGKIEFDSYQMRYRENTEIVLKGVNGKIKSCEKVGIVGRTGSGKSSICLSLFRLIEPHYGHILIDGVDIEEVGLDLLRQKICVIPQEPVLFQASLRENLDPFGEASNERLIEVLRHVQVFNDNEIESQLDKEVKEGGSNFSAGQRQLICIARALLRNSKIIFLDEATASIDYKTDALIQDVIKKEFKKCTVLTIAHRINTIMDYDRVIVMDKGVIAEFDTPKKLMEQDGIFSSLVKKNKI